MLAKKHRLNLALRQNAELFIRGNAQFFSSKYFLAYLKANQSDLKVACLTSKAALAKANSRNHYRRFLYSLVEKQIQAIPALSKSPHNLVIVLKRNFTVDKQLLNQDFLVLFTKIKEELNLAE